MLSDRVSSPGPLTYESGALPIALRGPIIRTILWYLGTHCCKSSFKTMRQLVLEKRFGVVVFFKYGHGSHVGHVTLTTEQLFVPKSP